MDWGPEDPDAKAAWQQLFAGTALADAPVAVPLSERDTKLLQVVRDVLRTAHSQNASKPINGPDLSGAFPNVWPAGLFPTGVPPLVVDANVLRNDVRRACRTGRTVLTTAANAGGLRLYCAQHVVDEVAEHSLTWAIDSNLRHEDFINRWVTEYMPLLRVVPDAPSLESLLAPDEADRLDRLTDHDDVPSVMLALVLGAFYLSEDQRALKAVYGEALNYEGHKGWLQILMAGGDAGELGKILFGAGLAVAGLGAGAYSFFRWVARSVSPWALIPLAAILGLAGARTTPETRTKVRSGLTTAGLTFGYAASQYAEAMHRFEKAAAPAPNQEQLLGSCARPDVLARACIHGLARSATSNLSARELAEVLPVLGVGQGEQLVRQELRERSYFMMVSPGRWQVGEPVSPYIGLLTPTVTVAGPASTEVPLGAQLGLRRRDTE